MSWGSGINSAGRSVGYLIEAKCDHPGCHEEIDRGVSFACGGMHDEDEYSCDKYFCEEHRSNYVALCENQRPGYCVQVCDECAKMLLESGDFIEDEIEGAIVRKK